MCISEVPKELQGLNSLEECLISRIATFITLVVLPRGHQRAIRSQVINFRTPMTNTVDQLPCPAEDTDIVCAAAQRITETEQDKGTSPARTYYCHCYGKVMLALYWLRTNNPLYQNVRLVAPHEQQFTKEEDECQEDVEESGIVRSNTLMPDIPVSKLIQDGAFPVSVALRLRNPAT